MKILITGSEGYLGSLLGPVLSERGYDVTGLDTGYYNDGCLYPQTDGLYRRWQKTFDT